MARTSKNNEKSAAAIVEKAQLQPAQPGELNWIANFIWGIAAEVLRDLESRGSQRQLLADLEDYLNCRRPMPSAR